MNNDRVPKPPKKTNRDLNTPQISWFGIGNEIDGKNRNPCDSCISNPKNGGNASFCHCTLGAPTIT